MDKSRKRYGYEWGCQVLMFRALHWLKQNEKKNPRFHGFKNITGLIIADNPAAKEMEKFALDHDKIREFGATGAMVQLSLGHAMKRYQMGEEKYFAEFADQSERIFEFDESDSFPISTVTQ